MNKSEAKRRLEEMQFEMEIENRASNLNRARSVTVGTAFGGTTELMMRSDGGRHIWCVMQPVEVIELIHQLAANVGCHMALKPREDFSSWRDWKVTDQEKLHYNGWAPFGNDLAPHMQIGANMQKYEDEKIAAKQKAFEELQQLQQETTAKLADQTDVQQDNTINFAELDEDITIEGLQATLSNKKTRELKKSGYTEILNGQPNVILSNDNEIRNKVIKKNNKDHTLGGYGGGTSETLKETIRKKKGLNK